MNVAGYILAALRDQGVSHVFMDPGGLNDTFMEPMTETEGVYTVVAAFEGKLPTWQTGSPARAAGLGSAPHLLRDDVGGQGCAS
jgi:hypothetical protein